MKKYFIAMGVIAVLSATLTIYFQKLKIDRQDMEIIRMGNNWNQATSELNELIVLTLRKDEVIGRYRKTLDSALKRLELRPKEVVRIVTNTIVQKDTVREYVYVTESGQDRWFLSDTGKCFLYEADVYLKDKTQLDVWRSNFEYDNSSQIVYYKLRPHKVWFVRFGKWEYKQDVSSECGESYTEDITFLKK